MSLPPYDQSIRELERQFQVVLPDSVGKAALGFREGVWYRVNNGSPRPVLIRSAIVLCPHAAGSIVQIACWWMRENAHTSRAQDLATELSLCVGELARKAIVDDPLGMPLDDPLSTSQQNALTGLATSQVGGVPELGGTSTYGTGSFATAGAGSNTTGAYDTGSYATGAHQTGGYQTGAYQTSNDTGSYAYPGGPAQATTMIPQIPDDGYGASRGPAIPPRGAGAPTGRSALGSSGGYPQRPAPQPVNGQPMRQQPSGRYPQQGSGQRPPQQRPMPRPDRYDEEPLYRSDTGGRPPARPPRDQGGNW